MEDSKGRETSEDGRGKGGKTVGIKIWKEMKGETEDKMIEEEREMRVHEGC